MITADKFGFAFREIEGHSVRFGENRSREYEEGDPHWQKEEPLLRAVLPVSFVDQGSAFIPEWEEKPSVGCLIRDNITEIKFPKKEKNRNERKAQGDLVGDHLSA